MPKVSVVLPVYNVAAHISSTIESLLKQTFRDFELLVLDDCSTDSTVAQVQAFTDPRVRLIQNQYNLGRAGTDNAAFAYVKGEYIAKMDGDDLCHPARLAQQVAYLDANPTVNVVGSWMQNFGASKFLNRYPADPATAQVLTLFTLPTGNPSVMLRTNLFREQGMSYNSELRQSEDYDFFARYIRQLRIVTLPIALIRYRVPPDVSKKTILTERATVADDVREQLLRRWGVSFSAQELRLHQAAAMLNQAYGNLDLGQLEAWLLKLLHHNEAHPLFEPAALQRGLSERWFEACYSQPRPDNMQYFKKSELSAYFTPTKQQRLKSLIKSLLN
jgi:glycosyltransferase involved in cell wall biosynthesis